MAEIQANDSILEPLYPKPYVVLYGRDSCPFTNNMKKELTRARIQYYYQVVDNPQVKKQLYLRMKKSGLKTSGYTLPVVDVNATLLVHPSPPKVIDQYFFE